MSRIAVFDTSIFIDQLRTGRHTTRINSFIGLIRTSSVVLSELWRGTRSTADREFLRKLSRNHPVLSPTEKNWIESGQILARMAEDHGFTSGKLRDLHFDALIALTARSIGARLITTNRADFELIKRYRAFDLEIW